MPDRIAHIGYPKTGSTFLQQQVFPELKDISYIDFHTCVELFADIIYLDDLDFDLEKSKGLFKEYFNSSEVLFSQEALTGPPFTFKGLNRSSIPERLKSLGFNKIIITVRNQVRILDSLYRQYIYQGGVMRSKDFLNFDNKWNYQLRAFHLDYLKYDSLIKLYFEIFGKENVLVVPQELLAQNAEDFLRRVCDFIGVELPTLPLKKSNESLSNASTNLLRIINHFTFNSQRPNQLISNVISTKTIKKVFQVILDPYFFKIFSSKNSYIKHNQADVIREYFCDSNTRLNDLVDFDLKDFGYLK